MCPLAARPGAAARPPPRAVVPGEKEVGIQDVRLHDLRNGFASRALALGETLPVIGKLLGPTEAHGDMGRLCFLKQPVIGFQRISGRFAAA